MNCTEIFLGEVENNTNLIKKGIPSSLLIVHWKVVNMTVFACVVIMYPEEHGCQQRPSSQM